MRLLLLLLLLLLPLPLLLLTESLGIDMSRENVAPDIDKMAQLMNNLFNGTLSTAIIITITQCHKT